jgi:hypothetical protein
MLGDKGRANSSNAARMIYYFETPLLQMEGKLK